MFLVLTKNKAVESELSLEKCYWFRFGCEWTKKCDHAGLSIRFALLWFNFTFDLYDFRHWDGEKDTWCEYVEGEKHE